MDEYVQNDAIEEADKAVGTRHPGKRGGDRVGQAERWYGRNRVKRRKYMRDYMSERRRGGK